MRKRPFALTSAVVIASMMLATVGVVPVAAAPGPADDRELTSVTPWATYTGQTAAQVNALLSANSARLTEIQVESSTPTFTVVMVKNSGAYKSSWWWYYGLTEADVNTQLSFHAARPIAISAYSTSAGVRYAVVMVLNSEANLKASWWYHGTASFITTQLTNNHARLINLSPYPGGGYVAIMVDNTGANLTQWWWYYGRSATQVTTSLTTNHARLVDLSRNANGTYNVVMEAAGTTRWYWFTGLTPALAVSKANQLGARIIDAASWVTTGTHAAVVMVDDLNAASRKLFNIISPTVDSGAYGFYLKEVGKSGSLAALQATKAYEPAGALELLYHTNSIHQESLGNTADATLITYHYSNLADPSDGSICPDDHNTTTTTNLKNGDTLMMQNGDYRMARGILEKYTKTAVLNYAKSLGLTATKINGSIGCPSLHNQTSLADLGKLYESFQNGTVTSNATWQAQFRSRMLNELNDEPTFHDWICPIVNQEATALGKSPLTATNFCNAITWISKSGAYQYASTFPYTIAEDSMSLTGLPYKSSGVTTPRYYVFGEFVDGTTINSQGEVDTINAARAKLYQEALRPYIKAALQTWT